MCVLDKQDSEMDRYVHFHVSHLLIQTTHPSYNAVQRQWRYIYQARFYIDTCDAK